MYFEPSGQTEIVIFTNNFAGENDALPFRVGADGIANSSFAAVCRLLSRYTLIFRINNRSQNRYGLLAFIGNSALKTDFGLLQNGICNFSFDDYDSII